MKQLWFPAVGVLAIVVAGLALSAQETEVRITYLYDNTVATAGLEGDWGFACLIQAHGRTVLFDTGARADLLRRNMEVLKVDPSQIQALILSHDHGDHTMGLDALPPLPKLPVYLGRHFRLAPQVEAALERIGAKRISVSSAEQVFPGFQLTGEMERGGIFEQGLVVDSPDGLVVIVGCAHPGIVSMLERVVEIRKRPVYAVIGGFHLMQTPAPEVERIIADLKVLGVQWAGPTHCTGEEAIRLFREAFGDRFVSGGVGRVVQFPKGSDLAPTPVTAVPPPGKRRGPPASTQ